MSVHRSSSLRHIPALDGLRAVAVLAVMASHISAGPRTAGGWLGVDIFFVLSGFLITSVLVREWDLSGQIRLGQFYLRRVLRLYPALIVMVLLGALFAPDLGAGGSAHGYLTTSLLEVTYTEDIAIWITHNVQGGFGHTWSLAVEEHFYLLWPIVLIALLRWRARATRWAMGGAVASLALLAAFSGGASMVGTPLTYYEPTSRAYELLLGCVIALFLRDLDGAGPEGRPSTRFVSQAWASASTYVGLLGCLLLIAVSGTTEAPQMWDKIAVCGLAAALAVLGLAVNSGSRPARLLSLAPMRYVGRISYGLYLYHYGVVEVFYDHVHVGGVLRPIILVGLTFGLAAPSYALIERPIMRWGRHRMAERDARSDVRPRAMVSNG